MTTVEQLNAANDGLLPDHLGVRITEIEDGCVCAEMNLEQKHMAPNGFLHAASVIALADTACGLGCSLSLPSGATSFTTVELKSNHLGTARDGVITCEARAVHAGRTTQVWDAKVRHLRTGKTVALFRATQMILYPRKAS